jgi:hypothetical protein
MGMLDRGGWHTLTWSCRGEPTGSIRIAIGKTEVGLCYRTRPIGSDWRDISESVPLVWTRPRLGGQRAWFRCLGCGRCCRVLYGGALFRCRLCHGLKHESQYEPVFARVATRAHHLRSRLGQTGSLDDPFPPKPKGMHWRTYRRLEALDDQLQTRLAVGIRGWLLRTARDRA